MLTTKVAEPWRGLNETSSVQDKEVASGLHGWLFLMEPGETVRVLPPRQSSFHLWIVLEGSAVLRLAGREKSQFCPKGTMLVVRSDDQRATAVAATADHPMRMLHLAFGRHRLPHLLSSQLNDWQAKKARQAALHGQAHAPPCPAVTTLPTPAAMAGLALRMISHFASTRPCDLLMLEAQALEMLSLALRALESPLEDTPPLPPQISRRDARRLQIARRSMLDQLDHPWTLRELASLAGINENKLKIGFRQLFGSSVYAYLQQHRMETAARLLSEGEESVIQVALAVGYSSPSHFSKLFRRCFGLAPSEFARRAIS